MMNTTDPIAINTNLAGMQRIWITKSIEFDVIVFVFRREGRCERKAMLGADIIYCYHGKPRNLTH